MTDLNALKAANAKRGLTHGRLLEVLSYDPETGEFVRIQRTTNAVRVGQRAGWLNPNGYRYIEVCGERFLAQRLAWFYVTGEWPPHEIDHKDCDRNNNRWSNLRKATRTQNSHNSRLKPSSTTGYKGVYFDKRYGKYAAKIRHHYTRLSLGYFDTAEEAHRAYVAKSTELYGEFARAA